MRVHADAHYVIGQSHLVNQDYALAGTAPVPWIVIADGCSTAPDTDLGARLIAHAATRTLAERLSAGEPLDPDPFLDAVAARASAAAGAIGLAAEALYATLGIACVEGDRVEVLLQGDGAVMAMDADGNLHLTRVEYSHNAPCYPAYRSSAAQQRRYRALSQDAVRRVQTAQGAQEAAVTAPLRLTLPLRGLAGLWLASDGLAAFVDAGTRERLPPSRIASSLVQVRSVEGGFVKRRLRRLLRNLSAEDIHPADDLAVAALVFGGE